MGIAMKLCQNNIIPLEAQYLYRRGREMMDLQHLDIALVYLRRAVFIAPGFSNAYRELCSCLDLLGRPEEASVYRMKASRSDPMHSGATIDGIAMKRQSGDQPVHVLTCRVC
jgi:tetratricopeptide (TPR) repeat protein